MYFTPLKEGEYAGKCAELCGEYHSQMLFTVKVVSEAEYERQMALLDEGQIGTEYNVNQNLPGNGSSEGEN
jgi:cytochrome c oxidase subunit 2